MCELEGKIQELAYAFNNYINHKRKHILSSISLFLIPFAPVPEGYHFQDQPSSFLFTHRK